MSKLIFISIFFFSLFGVSSQLRNLGFIMEFEGVVSIYRSLDVVVPRKERVSIVILEGEKLQHFVAIKYEKLYEKDIIVTARKSKAKLILKDKSVVFVDELGKLKLPGSENIKEGESILSLMYGKVRGVVVKSRRENMNVPTPGAVMGIRGTDFFIEYSPYTNKTDVAVIRGEVSLEETKKSKIKSESLVKPVKPIIIKAGYEASMMAQVVSHEKPVKEEDVKVEKHKEEINQPQKISLKRLDEAKFIAMVETPKKLMEKQELILGEAREEAMKSFKEAEKEIQKDIVQDKSYKISEKDIVDINAPLDKILDKTLAQEGVDVATYKKVPVELRVRAREVGMKDKELTPRNIREKSKTDPKVKSVFDKMVDMF